MEKDLNFYNFLKAMGLGMLAVPIGLPADESSTDKPNIILLCTLGFYVMIIAMLNNSTT